MTDFIEQALGDGGYVAALLNGYRARPGQIKMARAIDEALLLGRHAMIEAPTGTGKSLAYLVPTIRWAIDRQLRVLVVTANIALQEQLVAKDLPFLAEALPDKFTYALAKGRSNYLCLNQLDQYDESDVRDDDWDVVQDVLSWAQNAAQGSIASEGDFSELDLVVPHRIKDMFTVTADDCLGKSCVFREQCFAERAKARWQQAHVVVSNYALLFAHLRVRRETGMDLVLPRFDVVVLDEAHEAADIARDWFGLRISEAGIKRLGRKLPKRDQLKLELVDSAARLFEHLRFLSENDERLSPRIKRPLGVEHLTQPVLDAIKAAREYYVQQVERFEFDGNIKEAAVHDRLVERAERAHATLEQCINAADSEHAYFFEKDPFAICGKPVDVTAVLREELFEKSHAVIATSATITVENSFDHAINDLGMPDPDTLIVESPFNFREQSALVICSYAPDTNKSDQFLDFCAQESEQIIRAAGGRTLALFTSYRALNHVWKHLRSRSLPYKLMRQEEGVSKLKLIAEFKRDTRSCLLGTSSFWAGVDVSGEALSVVIIDKIPFPMKSDPLLDLLDERDGRRSFGKNWIPRATIQLKQGVGRLIRSNEDRGVVVVLDNRMANKPYGRTFVRSLPTMPRFDRPEQAIERVLGGLEPQQLELGAI